MKNSLDFQINPDSIMPMIKQFLVIALACMGSAAFAAEQSFDFKDPKGVNNVIFKTDALLESINGTATGVSGAVTYDPANPGGLKGKIVVEAASLTVPNSTMQGHLKSATWLDVAKYPQITFETASVGNVKTQGNDVTADVTGNFTLHGVTKQITVPVKLTYLKDKLKERFPSLQGDLLVIRANFAINRGDFGINKGAFEDKVSDEIQLTLSLAGQSPR
jgi:polyisoprenoid-binding protein YceI